MVASGLGERRVSLAKGIQRQGFVVRGGPSYNIGMRLKMAIVAVTAATLLSGCAYTSVSMRSTNSPVLQGGSLPAGTSTTGVSVRADLNPATYFGVAIFGYMLASIQDEYRRWMTYGYNRPYWREPPELAADRIVTEQDCSRAAVPSGANLRCR
jgi:hypothetical protein